MDKEITYQPDWIQQIFTPQKLFTFLGIIFLITGFGGIWLDAYYLILIPFALGIGILAMVDYSMLYFLLILCIPITIEIYLPNGLGIDLPGEILLIGLTAISPFVFLLKFKKRHIIYLKHPISIALGFHIFWILIAAILAVDITIGIKFFMAKLWYIIPFYGFSLLVLRDKMRYRAFFWSLMIPLFLSILYVLTRHAMDGFTFTGINSAVSPIFRNHVNYGILMVIFLPYVWAMYHWYSKGSIERVLLLGIGAVMLIAIYFTYTRAAQLAVVLAVGAYFIVRFRLVLYALLGAGIIALLLVVYLTTNNRYLEFAPQYEKAITHENYDNLLEATIKMEDISTVERVNRWIAGAQMVGEKPLSGFGPGSFYFNYMSFMVSSFVTYVSDNPDKSGIHNYYLMTMVEQGVPGFFFFITFLITILLYGTKVYHSISDPDYQKMVMAALVSIIVIAIVILINDLIEAIKVGSLFFIAAAIIVREDVRRRIINGKL